MPVSENKDQTKKRRRRYNKKKHTSNDAATKAAEEHVVTPAVVEPAQETVEEPAIKIQDIPEAQITRLSETHVKINEQIYAIETNYRDALNIEALTDRYTEILQQYHYIVGDWGFEQLRLRGFYANNTQRVENDKKIQTLEDYLYEYCNFGCAYFVLALEGEPIPYKNDVGKPARNRRNRLFDPFAKVNKMQEVQTRKPKWQNDNKRRKPKDKEGERSERFSKQQAAPAPKKKPYVKENAERQAPKKNKPATHDNKRNFIIRKKGDRS